METRFCSRAQQQGNLEAESYFRPRKTDTEDAREGERYSPRIRIPRDNYDVFNIVSMGFRI